jgi:hypothetical protein
LKINEQALTTLVESVEKNPINPTSVNVSVNDSDIVPNGTCGERNPTHVINWETLKTIQHYNA